MIEVKFVNQFASIYHDSVKFNKKIQSNHEYEEHGNKLQDEVFETLNSLLAYAFIINESSPNLKNIPSLFHPERSSNYFRLEWKNIYDFLCKYLQCSSSKLPGIFLFSPKVNTKTVLFDEEMIGRIHECLFSERFSFSLDEFPKSSKEGLDTNCLTPLIFDHLYQMKILDSELKIAHSGSYFSPNSEINYSLFFSLYYYLFGGNQTLSQQEKSSMISYLGNLFFERNNQRNNETISRDQKKIAILISQGLQNIQILDPTCGTGNFLVSFFHLLLKIGEDSGKIDDFLTNLTFNGCDLRSWALKITQFRIWGLIHMFFPGDNTKPINSIQQRLSLVQGDFLLDSFKFSHLSKKYDFIVGNPPYIRHRDINNPMKDSPSANEEYRRNIHDLITQLGLKQNIHFSNRMDYSLYFFVFGLEYLKPHGILTFISSNSWMNVKYGYGFQKYLLKKGNIYQIADNSYRSFKSAEINTVISFIGRNIARTSDLPIVNFVKWSIPYENINKKSIMSLLLESQQFQKGDKNEQTNLGNLPYSHSIPELARSKEMGLNYQHAQTETFRIFQITSENIKEWDKHIQKSAINSIKMETEAKYVDYKGFRWGNYFFSAPPSFYSIISNLGKNLAYLDTYSNISRGITTNCNNFFVFRKISEDTYQNGYGDEFSIESEVLLPFLMSPKQVSSPKVQAKDLDTYIFYTSYSKSELSLKGFTKTLNYIEYGENKEISVKKGSDRGKILKGVHKLASFKNKFSRNPLNWYCLRNPNPTMNLNPPNKKHQRLESSRIYIQKIFNDTFKIIKISEEIIVNNTFYEIKPLNYEYADFDLIFGIILGSMSVLCLELHGRTNFGGGALDTATFDIGKIIVPQIEKFTHKNRELIQKLSKKIESRKILPFSEEIRKEDKKSLDELIISLTHVDLTKEQLYKDIERIQKDRIKKSKTFEN
ncbi:MAG: Eco57I restriction-modification methylase domain-containing protein [Promethearchaeota archaeon]